MKKHLSKLTISTTILLLTMVAFSQAFLPTFAATTDEFAHRKAVAFAFPKDARFLFDAIEVSLLLPGQDNPITALTKPSQHLFVYYPTAQPNLAKKFSLQLVPQLNGKDIVNYDDLPAVSTSDLTFKLIWNCIEDYDPGNREAMPQFEKRVQNNAPCDPRNPTTEIYETVREITTQEPLTPGADFYFIDLSGERLDFNSKATNNRESLGVKPLRYIKIPPQDNRNSNPFAKVCKQSSGTTICATEVKTNEVIVSTKNVNS